MKDKFILDACCGGRCFWFNKTHPNTLYIDNRVAKPGHDDHRPNHCVKPDIVMDFTNLKFENKSFKLVVWDPPHLLNCEGSRMGKKYGSLKTETYPFMLSKGFDECMRVLDDYGVLVFKWNESSISLKKILKLFSQDPLFGHTTGSKSNTHWLCFMKIP